MKDEYVKKGRRAQKEKTRQNILEATQKMLDTGHDFTLEDVAKSANISRATIYRYFSSVEVLSIEASLDLKTLSPEQIFNKCLEEDLLNTFLNIQEHYNQLALDHESLFRIYLSAILNPSNTLNERGARRTQALSLAIEHFNSDLDEEFKDKLLTVATSLMGIEPMIITKDVCGLNDQESMEHLQWGLENLLKSIFS